MNESCSLDNWRKASNVSLSSHWCTAPESALCEEKATLTSLGCSTLKLPMHCLTLLRSNLGCTFADQLHCTVTPPLLCGLANASEGALQCTAESRVWAVVWMHTRKKLRLDHQSLHAAAAAPQCCTILPTHPHCKAAAAAVHLHMLFLPGNATAAACCTCGSPNSWHASGRWDPLDLERITSQDYLRVSFKLKNPSKTFKGFPNSSLLAYYMNFKAWTLFVKAEVLSLMIKVVEEKS